LFVTQNPITIEARKSREIILSSKVLFFNYFFIQKHHKTLYKPSNKSTKKIQELLEKNKINREKKPNPISFLIFIDIQIPKIQLES